MIVLDSCIWIHAFLNTDEKCNSISKSVLAGKLKPVVSSYIAKEVVDNIIYECKKNGYDHDRFQTAIWSIFREPFVKPTFTSLDYEQVVLTDIRNRPEYCALAQALGIESKDAPIIVLAYQYAVPLVTVDERSLLKIRDKIKQLINVEILTVEELLTIY